MSSPSSTAAAYYAGAPFYVPPPASAAAAEPRNKPRHWPHVSIESLYVDLTYEPPGALVDVRYPPAPPRVDGMFSPPTNDERLRRAVTARELAAPLVTAAGSPIVGETLTIATVCEVFIPDDDYASRGFEGYRGVTANRGRVRLRGAHEARDAAYGTATHEVWERIDRERRDGAQPAGDDEDGAQLCAWTVGDVIEIALLRFRERHPDRARCWGGGGRVGIWDELLGDSGSVAPRRVTLMRHVDCYVLAACD